MWIHHLEKLPNQIWLQDLPHGSTIFWSYQTKYDYKIYHMVPPSCEVTNPNIITGSTTWVDHLVKLANKTKNVEHSHKQVKYWNSRNLQNSCIVISGPMFDPDFLKSTDELNLYSIFCKHTIWSQGIVLSEHRKTMKMLSILYF